MITKYEHHGKEVFVDSELKGKHRNHCLCFKCDSFKPGQSDNCVIAQSLFEFCKENDMTTPVYECPIYREPTDRNISNQGFIAFGFDGTCVTRDYPEMGNEIEGAVEVLKDLTKEGWKLILLTMRSGKELFEAQKWLDDRGVVLFAVNNNPSQHNWTSSEKVYAHYYIDDAALGCPIVKGVHERLYVHWHGVRTLLEARGALKPRAL